MLISKKHSFIYIHVPKTAGTSISKALAPYALNPVERLVRRVASGVHRRTGRFIPFDPLPYESHISAASLREEIGSARFDEHFSFAFVRNPWDWLVSLYTYAVGKPEIPAHSRFLEFADFEDYIRWRCGDRTRYTLQSEYVVQGGEVGVDFIGRYERLEEDFRSICGRIGIQSSLPRLNVSARNPYQDYYTVETRELVEQTFRPDIERFGYDFNR